MHTRFGPYRLLRQDRRVEGPDGLVELSARAFDLLCVLLDHAGEVVSKDTIFAAVWPGVVVEENTLQVHVSALRKALPPGMIATVHGRGYQYAGPAPEPVAETAANLRPKTKSNTGPVIVVLPFDNLSGDPEQQYFSDSRRTGKAQAIVDRFAAEGRVFDFLAAAAREPYRDPEPRERLIAGLKLALQSKTAGR